MKADIKTIALFRNLLLGLLILYYSQGALIGQGTLLTQAALLLILGISFIYALKVFALRNIPSLVKAWTALIAINVLGFFFTGEFLNNPWHFDYLKAILVVLLPFYPFYYFALKGHLKIKHFLIFFAFMFPIAILQFNHAQALALAESSRDAVVTNAAYTFVGLIPFIFLIRNRILAYLSMAVISYFIIMGAKRGALLVGGVGFLLYAYYQIRTIPKKKQFQSYAMFLSGFIALIYFVNRFYAENTFLQERLQQTEEGDLSGRDVIYANIFNNWLNSEQYTQLLFGYGFLGSRKLSGTGNVAHNDWLELLANFGILGVLVYLVLFYFLFKNCFNSQWSTEKRILLLSIGLVWFVTTLFSMGFNAAKFTGIFLLIAYLIGSKNKNLI